MNRNLGCRVRLQNLMVLTACETSANERYVQDRQAHYVPDLLVIVIRENAYSKDAERGNVRDVTYADMFVTGERAPRSSFNRLDARHTGEGVWLGNLRLNGRQAMTAAEASLTVGPHVSTVHFGKAAK